MTWSVAMLRGADLRWLLDIEIGGQTYRLSDEPTTAPTDDGDDAEYRGGLEFSGQIEDRLELFSDAPSSRSVALTLHLAGQLDVPKIIREGADLAAATGRLMIWPEGGAAAEVVTMLDGFLDSPEYGAEEEPVTCTLREDVADDTGLLPNDRQVFDASTFPGSAGDVDAYGERYPICFGRPGSALGIAAGAPALYVDTNVMLIAGHHVEAGTVSLMDGTLAADLLTVQNGNDGLDQPFAWVSTSAIPNIGAITIGDPYYVRWYSSNALMDGDRPIRGAGSVLRWLLRRSSMRWDSGRLAVAEPYLDRYQIDGFLSATPERRVAPWDWINDHLTPILPISWRVGPLGIYPVVWRFDALDSDAVAEIDVDGARAARASPVSYSERSKIRNDLVLRWAADPDERYQMRLRVCGDVDAPDVDGDASVLPICRLSRARYGSRPIDLSSDVIQQSATAGAVLGWLARRYALPSRTVSYDCDQTMLAAVEPGSVVIVRDAEVGLRSQVALVESLRYSAEGTVGVTVRVIEDVARDQA